MAISLSGSRIKAFRLFLWLGDTVVGLEVDLDLTLVGSMLNNNLGRLGESSVTLMGDFLWLFRGDCYKLREILTVGDFLMINLI